MSSRRGHAWRAATRLAIVSSCVLAVSGAAANSAAAAASPCANLRIEGVTIKPTEPGVTKLIAGQPAAIEATISNTGKCAAGTFVVAFKLSRTSPTAVSESVSGLGSGESTTVELPYDFPSAGSFDAVLEDNPAHEVKEFDYSKDTVVKAISVAAAKVRFAITGFTITPSPIDPTGSPVQGRLTIATVTVENTGNVPVGPFTVDWTPSALATPLSQTGPGLAAGESVTVPFSFVYTKAGPVVSTASASATGAYASAKLEEVVEPPLPNLRISRVASDPAVAGSPSSVEVTVENDGNAAAGPFLVEWQPGPSQPPEAQQVEGLAEGESTSLTFFNTFAKAGTYDGLVIADSSDQLEEVSPTEKTAATVLEIPAATIDLAVEKVRLEPAKPTAGSLTTFIATVKNVGNTASPALVTDLRPGTGGGPVAEGAEPLGPGESREIALSYTYPKAGLLLATVEVNPSRSVPETDYANNKLTVPVVVRP